MGHLSVDSPRVVNFISLPVTHSIIPTGPFKCQDKGKLLIISFLPFFDFFFSDYSILLAEAFRLSFPTFPLTLPLSVG